MKCFNLKYQNRTFVRWENWQEFVENIEKINYEKPQKIALFFLTYNLSELVIKLVEQLNKDSSRKVFDIIIVDNHSQREHKVRVTNYLREGDIKNVIYLYTMDNLWCSGGNAIGLEYILSQKYEYIIFTEDDAFPTDSDLVSKMIACRGEKVVIRTMRLDGGCPSNPFHFTLYPRRFIELVGVPNPLFFMRADDEDFYFRMEKIVKEYKYQYMYMEDSFHHPMIKKGAGKYRQVYFSLRNAFQAKMQYFRTTNFLFAIKDVGLQFCRLFAYIWAWISKLFIEKNIRLLQAVGISLWDFVMNKFTYLNNKSRLLFFNKIQNNSVLSINYQRERTKKINELTKDKYLLDIMLSSRRTYSLKFSKKIQDFFCRWCIVYTFNLPLYPLMFFAPEVVSIEEYDLEKEMIYLWICKNVRTHKNILLVIIAFIGSIFLFIPLVIILLIKILLFKIIRWIWK